MARYEGFKNWTYWNVHLWLHNDEQFFRIAANMLARYPTRNRDFIVKEILRRFHDEGITHTPDGALLSKTSLRVGLVGMTSETWSKYCNALALNSIYPFMKQVGTIADKPQISR